MPRSRRKRLGLMLVSTKKIILDAQNGGYAVGAFNTSDFEITKAILAAAVKLSSPVIIQTSEKSIAYAGLEVLASMVREMAQKVNIPIALHLDHGSTLEIVGKALENGYTSVMYDCSGLTFFENISFTCRAVEIANRYNATCEGELGSIGKIGKDSDFTNPSDVSEFVKKTQVDMLAISIGSKHGDTGDEKLDINLLKKIKQITNIPLVLHGASGLPEEDIKQAIKNGICKINIDTDIRHTFSRAVREIPQQMSTENDPRIIMTKVMVEIQKLIEAKIKLFGSVEKA